MFKTTTDIETPKPIEEKKIPVVHPIENFNNHLIVGRQISNGEKEYQCNICNMRFHDLNNLEVHKPLHANIKTFKCTACDEQFFELNDLKSHLISHIDHNIKFLENQFLHQQCNDVGEFNR